MEKPQSSTQSSRKPVILAREFPCPKCGYDLRASPTGLCPECGTITPRGEMTSSRIPWVDRSTRGPVKAYLATLWMFLRRPGTFPRELLVPQRRRDAESFHRISVLLAVFIATLLTATSVALNPPSDLPDIASQHLWLMPAFVLMDSWWGLLPLVLGLWIGTRIALAGYRWIASLGVRGEIEKRRAARLAFYMSGCAPLVALFAGWFLLATTPESQLPPMLRQAPEIIGIATILIALPFGIGVVFIAPVLFVAKIGRLKFLRSLLMLACAPVAAGVLLLSLALCSWLAGYVAIVIRSATR